MDDQKSQSVLQQVVISLFIGSPDIQIKLPQLGILWNCLIHHPGPWFLHQLYLWQFSFSSRPELELHILESGQFMRKLSSLPLGKLDLQSKQSKSSHFRVPLINSQSTGFNFGFASNMTLLLWCVCGGFLLHMLESNYLSMLLKPNYEKPVDTAEDIIDRGLAILTIPPRRSMTEMLKKSPFYITRTLAERTIVPKVIFLHFNINTYWIVLIGLGWLWWKASKCTEEWIFCYSN